jgi:dihydroneopterin aldolase
MDIVYIRGLQVDTIIGIYDFERAHRQILVLDLELGTDVRPAAAVDDITLTLNYKAITETVEDFVKRSEFALVETLAQRCAEMLMTDFAVPWLRLSLSKPGAMRQAKDVGIVIERGQR